MTLYAVLSDIHANLPALQAVEQDARAVAEARGLELRFVCLGDVVDYGPHPNQCMEWVIRNVDPSLVVQGNHDRASGDKLPPQSVTSTYWPITMWTRFAMRPDYKSELMRWQKLQDVALGSARFLIFHGDDGDEYIQTEATAKRALKKMNTSINYALFGHSHCQGFFQRRNLKHYQEVLMAFSYSDTISLNREPKGWKALPVPKDSPKVWPCLPERELQGLFNPGSVGQPRRVPLLADYGVNFQPHAAYLLINQNGQNPGEYLFRQIPYKVEDTIKALEQEVIWPVINPGDEEAHSLYRQPKGQQSLHYFYEDWQKTFDNMDARLPEVKKTLIATLLNG